MINNINNNNVFLWRSVWFFNFQNQINCENNDKHDSNKGQILISCISTCLIQTSSFLIYFAQLLVKIYDPCKRCPVANFYRFYNCFQYGYSSFSAQRKTVLSFFILRLPHHRSCNRIVFLIMEHHSPSPRTSPMRSIIIIRDVHVS